MIIHLGLENIVILCECVCICMYERVNILWLQNTNYASSGLFSDAKYLSYLVCLLSSDLVVAFW